MGERNARRYFLTAEVFDADEALQVEMLSILTAKKLDATVSSLVEHPLRAARRRTPRSRR